MQLADSTASAAQPGQFAEMAQMNLESCIQLYRPGHLTTSTGRVQLTRSHMPNVEVDNPFYD